MIQTVLDASQFILQQLSKVYAWENLAKSYGSQPNQIIEAGRDLLCPD